MVSAILESALLRTWSNAVLLSATPASCVTLQPPVFAVSRARAALWPRSFSLLGVRIPSAPLSRRGSCLEGTFLVPLVAGLLNWTQCLNVGFSLLLPFDCEGRICSLLNIFTNSTFIQQKFWHILGTVNKEAKVPDFTKLTFLVGKNRQT